MRYPINLAESAPSEYAAAPRGTLGHVVGAIHREAVAAFKDMRTESRTGMPCAETANGVLDIFAQHDATRALNGTTDLPSALERTQGALVRLDSEKTYYTENPTDSGIELEHTTRQYEAMGLLVGRLVTEVDYLHNLLNPKLF